MAKISEGRNVITANDDYDFQVPIAREYTVEITYISGATGTVSIATPDGQDYTDHSGVTADQIKVLTLRPGTNVLTVASISGSIAVNVDPVWTRTR